LKKYFAGDYDAEMKVNEVEPGQIFTIDNTLIYPKLKLHTGGKGLDLRIGKRRV